MLRQGSFVASSLLQKMSAVRIPAFVFVAAMALSFASQAAARDHDPHPLTPSEKEIFYPLVCIDPQPGEMDDGRMCREVLGAPDNRNLAGERGDPIRIEFSLIAYGSFTKAGANEAYITYSSSMEPEGDYLGGGILFRRKNGHWNLVRLIHGGQMSECVALPTAGRERMLCTVRQHFCCGASSAFVKVISGINIDRYDHKNSLLRAGDSRMEFEEGIGDAERYEFCRAGAEGRPLLLSLRKPERSHEQGIFASVEVEYVRPKEIRRACSGGNHPQDAKTVLGKVRFILSGGRVKVLLPKDVKAFSTFF